MRIGLFGNTGNVLYQLGKALRAHTDLDVHLFIDAASHPSLRPESDDPHLGRGYPPWIHEGDYTGGRTRLAPWSSALIPALKECDLLVMSGIGPVYAPFANRPWAFLATGGDLTMTPFPLRFWFLYPGLRGKIGNLATGIWQRRGIQRATEIWSHPFRPFVISLERLRYPRERIVPRYFPQVLDVAQLSDDQQAPPAALADLEGRDFVLFHPSRMLIRDEPPLREVGQWKQNDELLRAWARFVRLGHAQSPTLAMPDRADASDLQMAKRLVAELGIQREVTWLRPPRPTGFTRAELIPFYQRADVVAADFGAGWFGLVVLEALAMRRPVINYVDQAAMSSLYPWHPIVNARNATEIVAELSRLHARPEDRIGLGDRGRRWIEQFHSADAAAPVYLKHLMRLAERSSPGMR